VTQPHAQQLFSALIVSAEQPMAENIQACFVQFATFSTLDICRNGVAGLQAIASQLPDLMLIVAPLPDRQLSHVIKEAKRKHGKMRMIVIADWAEFAGFSRAKHKGADGFISARLLSKELPSVLAQYPHLLAEWGTRFSPWKTGYGMA